MANATAARAVKAALVTRLKALFPAPVVVTYGFPDSLDAADDIMWIGDLTSDAQLANMGPTRSREESLRVEVIIQAWSGSSSQQAVTERAYGYLEALETSLHVTETTLGGVCRTSRIVSHQLTETAEEAVLSEGRVAQLNAIVEVKVRLV